MRTRPGFTLLESLVALVVVGLALLTTVAAVSRARRTQHDAVEALRLAALADARMSELALLPADSVASYRTAREGGFAPPVGRHRWRALLRDEPGTPGLVRAAVLVAGPGGEYTLETLLHYPEGGAVMTPRMAP